MTSVRPIETKDKEQFFELFSGYLEFYKSTLTDHVRQTTWNRFFDDSEPVYAAVAHNEENPHKLIGFVTWVLHRSTWSDNHVIYLHDLFVDPECRLKGTGRKLIEYVYADADKRDIGKVYWHTQTFNHRAQLLYTKVGFRDEFVSYQRHKK
jgi:D-amino-acid N-acetyltransferase